MGKLFPHPVGVFRTIPNPPKSRIIQKIDFFRKTAISSNIHIFPTTVGNPLLELFELSEVRSFARVLNPGFMNLEC